MPVEGWSKKRTDEPIYQGPRSYSSEDLARFDADTRAKIELILEAMQWPQFVAFIYKGDQRVVAPFVVGISSEGNPLLRGFQVRGVSTESGGTGWRVFQLRKCEGLENQGDYFYPDEFDFDRFYPWIYKVYRTL